MKTLLRIYLVVIFAGSAMDAGSVNDSINSGFPTEASNFAKPSYPENLEGITNCINPLAEKEYRTEKRTAIENISE